MRMLSTIKKRSKHGEATTDESQRSASNWRNIFKILHWPRVNHCRHEKQRKLELQNLDPDDDDCTESCLDLFQTLMSNAAAAPPSECRGAESETPSSKYRSSLNNWHTDDQNFLPTAYPLIRMDPRSQVKAKWRSLNSTASAALAADQLKRFEDDGRDKRPVFRLGPRPPPGENGDDASSIASLASSASSRVMESGEPTYAYIAQDGKLVERQTNRWPKRDQPKLSMRYKLCEPYASNYGSKAGERAGKAGQKCILPRTRYFYERPIFRLPRSIVNENKRRLISRHMLKDRHEPTPCYRLPCMIKLNEREQFMRFREYQTIKSIKDVKSCIALEENAKRKADAAV